MIILHKNFPLCAFQESGIGLTWLKEAVWKRGRRLPAVSTLRFFTVCSPLANRNVPPKSLSSGLLVMKYAPP
jgi:hypothetical protein